MSKLPPVSISKRLTSLRIRLVILGVDCAEPDPKNAPNAPPPIPVNAPGLLSTRLAVPIMLGKPPIKACCGIIFLFTPIVLVFPAIVPVSLFSRGTVPVTDGLRFVGPIIGVSEPKKPAIVLAGPAIPVNVLATSPSVLVNPLAKFEKNPCCSISSPVFTCL